MGNLKLSVSAVFVGCFVWCPALAQTDVAQKWGTRSPMVCSPLKQKAAPTPVQATKLVQCNSEYASDSSGELRLMQNVKVEIGKSSSFVAMYNQYVMPAADTTKRTYPIRGSFDWATCMLIRDASIYGDPVQNCQTSRVASATGVCWQTTFGDWKCLLNGAAGPRAPSARPR